MILTSRSSFVRTAALSLTSALLFAVAGHAAEINVVSSGGFTAAYLQLAPEYERSTHNKLHTEFGPSMGRSMRSEPRLTTDGNRRHEPGHWRDKLYPDHQ